MIHSFRINNPTQLPHKWWEKTKIPFEIFFRPGINLLCGPNGCGKSSLLNLFATHFHCKQGGTPMVSQTSIENLWGGYTVSKGNRPFDKYTIEHDGALACYFSPDDKPGLIGGMAAFDYDFGMDGILNAMDKGSSGMKTQRGLIRLLSLIAEGKVKMEYKMSKKRCNEVWVKRLDRVEALLAPNVQSEKPLKILLLDEPERALDARAQLVLYDVIKKLSQRMQIICATHSPLFMTFEDANFIDMEDNYSNTVKELLLQIRK